MHVTDDGTGVDPCGVGSLQGASHGLSLAELNVSQTMAGKRQPQSWCFGIWSQKGRTSPVEDMKSRYIKIVRNELQTFEFLFSLRQFRP